MSDVTIKTRIHGRVQGVAYRAWAEGEALKLGLQGWVRNRLDGSVEALFRGPSAQIDSMIASLHDGPPASNVHAIDLEPVDGVGLRGFEIKPTA